MKKLLFCLALVSLLVLALAGTASAKTPSLKSLAKTVASLQKQVKSQAKAISTLQSNLKAAQKTIASQGQSIGSLNTTVAGHTTSISSLQANVTSLNTTVAGIAANPVLTLSWLPTYLSLDSKAENGLAGPNIVFQKCNVHVKSSSSESDTSGLGNLIVGWDDNPVNTPSGYRSGSNNLICGDGNSFTSWGCFAAGCFSTVSNTGASVSGGYGNQATAAFASVSGGEGNQVTAYDASVSGGSFVSEGTMDGWSAGGSFHNP